MNEHDRDQLKTLKERLERANQIFSNWLEVGDFNFLDVFRVINGQYHYFVTFKGQIWDQNPGAYGVITEARTKGEARRIAVKIYGKENVDKIYEEWDFHLSHFPRGAVSRHSAIETSLD